MKNKQTINSEKTKEKSATPKNIADINKIPDYDGVFRDSAKKGGNGKGVVTGLLKNKMPSIAVSFVFYIIKSLPVYIIPIISSAAIDEISAEGGADMRKILLYAIIMLVSLIQNMPTHMVFAKITDNILRYTGAGIKETVVRKLQRLSITYHTEMESGKLQSKFLRDTDSVDQYLRMIFYSFMPTVLSLIINIGITLYRSPIVALFFIVVVPFDVLLTRHYRKPISQSYGAFRKENENLASRLTQMLEMLQITKAHGLENEEIKKLDENIKRVTQRGLDADKTVAQFGSYSWVVAQFFNGVCLFFTVIMAIKGVPGFTAGSVLLFQSLFSQINGGVQTVINSFPQMASGQDAILSLSEIMNSEDVENYDGKTHINTVKGDVCFKNVSYRYPDSREDVISHFSLNVKAGECIAFVGASGSGKSTIMNMIIGFLKPTDGKLYIDNKDISEINLSQYRKNLSVVPQNSVLFEGSIRENITYGLKKYTQEQLDDAVRRADIEEFLKELPNGLDSNVGEHGGKLSGGQKQRIAIARALIRNPSILILDEATSALDNLSEYHVQKAIESVIKGRTTFIVAHRLSTVRCADRIVCMDNGTIAEVGTYDELMALKGKFYELKRLNEINTKQ